MTTYVTVAAVRIQSWLVRTPMLALLRGASAALSHETAAPQINAALARRGCAPDVAVADDAGDVDGIVVVTVSPPRSPSDVARMLTEHLRRKLPAVEWEAWWTDADSYLDALLKYDDRIETERLLALPRLLEATLATSCSGCRSEAAGEQAVSLPGGEDQRLGADCLARYEHRYRPRSRSDALPGKRADDFTHLARAGGVPGGEDGPRAVGRRDSRNHLATVAADGNKIGDLFRAIHGSKDVQLRERAVTALDEATKAATYEALRGLAADPGVSAGIRHYTGGDDVLVSVPAPLAWEFCARLGAEFEVTFRRLVRNSKPGSDEPVNLPPSVEQALSEASLGIGVVFAHSSHPFADTQTLAHSAMRQAKKLVRARSCAVSWLDLTVESATAARRVLPLPALRVDLGLEDAVDESARARSRRWNTLVALGPSARAALGDLLGDWDSSSDEPTVDATLARVLRWVRRTQHAELLATWQDTASSERGTPGLSAFPVATRCEILVELRDGLSRARWWPLKPPSRPSAHLSAAPGGAP